MEGANTFSAVVVQDEDEEQRHIGTTAVKYENCIKLVYMHLRC